MKSQTFDSSIERLDASLGGMHVIPVPLDVATQMKGAKRVLITLGSQTYPRALQATDSVSPYIMMGQQVLKAHDLRFGSPVSASIRPDPKPNAPEIAAELLEALSHDDDARARWDTFTPGKRRSVNHYLTTAKRPETRIRRAVELVQKIREYRLHGDLPK